MWYSVTMFDSNFSWTVSCYIWTQGHPLMQWDASRWIQMSVGEPHWWRDSMVAIRVTAFHFMKRLRSRQQGDPGVLDVLDVWDLVSDLVMRQLFLVGFDCMPLDSLRNETNKLTRAWRMEVWRKACTEALVATSSLELYLSYCRIALVSHNVSASSQNVQ